MHGPVEQGQRHQCGHESESARVCDAGRFGWSSAASCARTCTLPMIAMLALPTAHQGALAVMAALVALALLDRAVHPARRPWLAAGYAALGLACVL